jgi:hypothetical protein
MLSTACSVLAPHEDKIASENAKLNDKICKNLDKLNMDLAANGLPLVSLEQYVDKVNAGAKRSEYSLKCK